ITDALNAHSKTFFDAVLKGLNDLNIPHQVNTNIVRGLDYYTHTTFEFITTELGSQGTVLAGGRYDGLVKQLGGPDIPGVGWGSGIERLAMLLTTLPAKPRPISLVPMGEAAEALCLKLAYDLRQAGSVVDLGYTGNMKKRLERANKAG